MSTTQHVSIWEETIHIPTYGVADPDPNPRFYEKRAYQGSIGKVYPLPVTEKILDEKEDVAYKAVFLENDYLKVMFLPEIGGRIQRATDKTNNYDFVYYNHVIKPALVGLTGPWISGGIEFNWPQHHRPSTYSATEYKLIENKNGSKSLIVSEIDKMYGTKGSATFTLHPDKAYIEIKGQLYNRTDLPQTFLWWANPAVPVNDFTSSIFPPDVTAVLDHGKRAVATFPIATGEYYKVDYSAGVDISKYKNIPVPTSYMAEKSEFDFIGNYDEQKQAGLLHIADHHVSPGKKQWTWGNGDFGQAWDRNLTDEDGPYIELMTGVFTDNQPDFTWLRPYEEKEFTQYFMPYKGVGYIKNATIDAAVNFEKINNKGIITVYVTSEQKNCLITVYHRDELIFEATENLTPASFYQEQFDLDNHLIEELLRITVTDSKGKQLVRFDERIWPEPVIPKPAEEIPAPEKLQTTEELFLAATHLEQYRHATREAADYYLEGLKRDASDIRLNTGYGTLLYRQGEFLQAEKHLRQATKKQMWKTPNPYYGEPLFQLGLVLAIQGKRKDAYDTFYKATWNDDTQGSAFFKLGTLAAQNKDYVAAENFLGRALIKNSHNMKARMLQILILEAQGQVISEKIEEALKIDPLDLAINRKKAQLENNLAPYHLVMRNELNNYLTLALDYIEYGFLEEALTILNECPLNSPLVYYYKAFILIKQEKLEQAKIEIQQGEAAPSTYCFPNKIEELIILEKIIEFQPEAYFAAYYLGNLLYDKKQYDYAISLWEKAKDGLPDFPTVYRNLSFAKYNKENKKDEVLILINQAFELDKKDARVLLEKTQLEEMLGVPVLKRLQVLEENMATTQDRDDLFIEFLTLLNLVGRHEEVVSLTKNRRFHPWEGGEGKIPTQYTLALTELGRMAIFSDLIQAKRYLEQSKIYPKNLGEGKLPSNHDNKANYYLGEIALLEEEHKLANEYFTQATKGLHEPGSALYYNDEPSDIIYYQGLAFKHLGDTQEADKRFDTLIQYGEKHKNEIVEWDFFAVSAPAHSVYDSDIQLDNYLYCLYLQGLGYLGKEQYDLAQSNFGKILSINPAHQGALLHNLLMS